MVGRKLMGVERFDLDIATDISNPTKAKRIYTEYNSALLEGNSWEAETLWCNPPFSLNLKFSEKLERELPRVKQAVWLSKCDSRPRWARILIDNCVGIVIKEGYVRFMGSEQNAPFGILLYLFGDIDKKRVNMVIDKERDYRVFWA